MTRRRTIAAFVVLFALSLVGYWLLVLVYGTHAVTAVGGDGEALRSLLPSGPVRG